MKHLDNNTKYTICIILFLYGMLVLIGARLIYQDMLCTNYCTTDESTLPNESTCGCNYVYTLIGSLFLLFGLSKLIVITISEFIWREK